MNIEKIIQELNEERASLLFDTNAIKDQINFAQAFEAERNVDYDKIWLAKAKSALRHKLFRLDQINLEIHELKSVNRKERSKKIENKFVDVARAVLDKETFMKIMQMAHDELRLNGDID